MEHKITTESESCEIKEVKVCWSVEEANKLLKKSWILLHSGIADKDPAGFHQRLCFILGRIS